MTKPFLPPLQPIKAEDFSQGDKSGATSLQTNYKPVGVANKKKLIIGAFFSENGTAENRQAGNYGFPTNVGGGVIDPFRDAMGKYWTYTSNEKNEVTFLSPDIQAGSKGENGSYPASIYFNKPTLLDDNVWPEYEQSFYVTPYEDWLYSQIVTGYFDTLNEQALKIILADNPNLQGEQLQEQIDLYVDSQAGASNFMANLTSWWKGVMTDSDDKTCQPFANTINVSPEQMCKKWINFGQTYVDHALDLFLPIEIKNKDQDQVNIGTKFPYFSLESEYNFYIRKYEEVIKGSAIAEKLLPNMHVFISSFAPDSLTGEKSDYNKYKSLITLDGLLEDFDSEALKITQQSILESGDLKTPPVASRQYFNYWSNTLANTLVTDPSKITDITTTVASKYNIVLFPMQYPDILQNYNDQRYMFPMYNELAFSTGAQNVVGDMLRQTRLSNDFMKFYASVADERLFGPEQQAAGLAGAAPLVNQNPFVTSAPFVEEVKTLSLGETANGTKIVGSSSDVDTNKQIQLTDVEAFLATLDIKDVVQDNSNFDLTQDQMQQVDNFFNNNQELDSLFHSNAIFVTKDDNEEFALSKPSNAMHRAMLCVMMLGKLRKLAKEQFRAYHDIMTGKTNYAEAIMYVVNKSKISNNDQESPVLQSYYFLNSSETDVLTFVDTQAHYDTVYKYTIEAIVLSVGTSYEYTKSSLLSESEGQTDILSDVKKFSNEISKLGVTNPMFGEKNNSPFATIDTTPEAAIQLKTKAEEFFEKVIGRSSILVDGQNIAANILTTKVTVRAKPNYKLLRVEYATVEGRILDKPPIFPDALITPYKGESDKLLITLNQNVGEYFMKPIIINQEEQEQYEKMFEAQKIGGSLQDKPAIEYKADDAIARDGYFEVYRTESKPRAYKDFREKLVTIIRGYHELEVGHLDTNSVALRDVIEPNKKYYYMFRVVDVHGHVSNPSPIFQVELVDDNGTVYLLQEVIELAEPNNKIVNKDIKKYLQIKPTFEQSLLNVPQSTSPLPSAFDYGLIGTEGDIELGTASTKIWGKKFKIRLTSKSSGKQIDLNVTFTRSEDDSQAKNAEVTFYSKPRP